MHRLGSRIHVLIGLWILAGLMVMGVNGFMLVSLLDEPLAGYSDAVRSADRGFRQYRMLLTAQAEKISSGMDLLASRFKSIVVQVEKTASQEVPDPPPVVNQAAPLHVELPTLTGIFTSRTTGGPTLRLAVMDGRICNEGDRLGDFRVTRIANDGVSLVRGGRAWFLKSPEIAYSLTTQ